MNNAVKIIGGKFRGYKLEFPSALGLRPTPNRIRETVFNWLMHDIQGNHCLDLFAGSGALSVEALSRGASSITAIEKNPKVWLNLNQQLARFNSEQIQLIQTDAVDFLSGVDKIYDLVFLDPPFGQAYIDSCLDLLLRRKIIHANTLIYLESESKWVLNDNWQELKHKVAGQVHYGLVKLAANTEVA